MEAQEVYHRPLWWRVTPEEVAAIQFALVEMKVEVSPDLKAVLDRLIERIEDEFPELPYAESPEDTFSDEGVADFLKWCERLPEKREPEMTVVPGDFWDKLA